MGKGSKRAFCALPSAGQKSKGEKEHSLPTLSLPGQTRKTRCARSLGKEQVKQKQRGQYSYRFGICQEPNDAAGENKESYLNFRQDGIA
ncbi:MAG: hypothetical protein AAB393_12925, partial [Bacteroidota bacterium]